MNSNEIELYKSLREKIIKQINIVLPQYCEIKKIQLYGEVDSFEFLEDNIEIKTVDYVMGEILTEYYTLPTICLTDEKWIEELKSKALAEEIKKLEQERIQKLKEEKEEEELEKATYERLKKKYENK